MARPNILDRIVAAFDPVRGARRLQAREAFQAFSGDDGLGSGPASPLNSRWRTTPRSPDADIIRSLPRQRAQSRDLRRTNPIAEGAIATNINRVVGTGLQPVPMPDLAILGWTEERGAAWASQWASLFSMWADSKECTLDGGQTFYERQALVLGARLESGDCFTILPDVPPTSTQPFKLRLQTVEADRCGNPMGVMDSPAVVAGVRMAPGTGAPEAYHIYDVHPGSTLINGGKAAGNLAGQWYTALGRSGRRRILHHYRPSRPEQTRGVPYLAPVIQAIKDLGRYTEAEITAAVMSAFYTVFIEQEGGGSPAPVFGADGQHAHSGQSEPPPGPEVALAPGAVVGLAKGEKVSIADPNRPNTAYEPFVLGILKLIGMGLGLPVELLVKSFNSSYSASKAALLDAWQHFRSERQWLVLSFCQPVYETLLAEAVASGRIAAPGFFTDPLLRWAYTRAAWHGDSQGSINPKDEVAAYRDAIDGRLMTHERAEWELFGSDWTRTYPTKRRELAQMTRDGILPAPKAGASAAQQPVASRQAATAETDPTTTPTT